MKEEEMYDKSQRVCNQKQKLIESLEKENKKALDAIEILQCKVVSKNAELYNLKKELQIKGE